MPETPSGPTLHEEMDSTIARTLKCWTRIEMGMVSLLAELLGPSKQYEAYLIYYAPNNTETRFKIVNVVARFAWEKYTEHNLISEWKSIEEKLNRAKLLRNSIAHGVVEVVSKKGKTFQARLVAHPLDITRRWKEAPRQWPGKSVHDVKLVGEGLCP
jgi:hypothetical protein